MDKQTEGQKNRLYIRLVNNEHENYGWTEQQMKTFAGGSILKQTEQTQLVLARHVGQVYRKPKNTEKA